MISFYLCNNLREQVPFFHISQGKQGLETVDLPMTLGKLTGETEPGLRSHSLGC